MTSKPEPIHGNHPEKFNDGVRNDYLPVYQYTNECRDKLYEALEQITSFDPTETVEDNREGADRKYPPHARVIPMIQNHIQLVIGLIDEVLVHDRGQAPPPPQSIHERLTSLGATPQHLLKAGLIGGHYMGGEA